MSWFWAYSKFRHKNERYEHMVSDDTPEHGLKELNFLWILLADYAKLNHMNICLAYLLITWRFLTFFSRKFSWFFRNEIGKIKFSARKLTSPPNFNRDITRNIWQNLPRISAHSINIFNFLIPRKYSCFFRNEIRKLTFSHGIWLFLWNSNATFWRISPLIFRNEKLIRYFFSDSVRKA